MHVFSCSHCTEQVIYQYITHSLQVSLATVYKSVKLGSSAPLFLINLDGGIDFTDECAGANVAHRPAHYAQRYTKQRHITKVERSLK